MAIVLVQLGNCELVPFPTRVLPMFGIRLWWVNVLKSRRSARRFWASAGATGMEDGSGWVVSVMCKRHHQ